MATRCTIKIDGVDYAKIYKHWDGYPEANYIWLKEFNDRFNEHYEVLSDTTLDVEVDEPDLLDSMHSAEDDDDEDKYPDVIVISGGGIQNIETAQQYKNIGANHISVSSLCFHPWKFVCFYSLYSYYY